MLSLSQNHPPSAKYYSLMTISDNTNVNMQLTHLDTFILQYSFFNKIHFKLYKVKQFLYASTTDYVFWGQAEGTRINCITQWLTVECQNPTQAHPQTFMCTQKHESAACFLEDFWKSLLPWKWKLRRLPFRITVNLSRELWNAFSSERLPRPLRARSLCSQPDESSCSQVDLYLWVQQTRGPKCSLLRKYLQLPTPGRQEVSSEVHRRNTRLVSHPRQYGAKTYQVSSGCS